MSATFADTRPAQLGWLDWLRCELAPSHERRVRTLILICGAVLCVIISMALQVPQLATSAYMVFFISKESKTVTTLVGVLGLIGLTIGIAVSLLLYKFTYGHAELRIPSMAIVLFLGMYASRILVIGPLGFIMGFVIAVTQSIGDLLPSSELLVRAILWLWVALAYAVGLTVVLNRLFLPEPTGSPKHLPKPKNLFVPDAFTNPAHVRFALKVTLSAMFCYLLYTGIDWFGIHTAFITCVFIALESTGATLRKGLLRAVGCIIGGLLALFSIIFLIPHMETIASLVVLVACVSAIAGWVATGTERISYAGSQIAFSFFSGLFPGFEGFGPEPDLPNVRNGVVVILLGVVVTSVVFHYLWPERASDKLRTTLARALRNLDRLVRVPNPCASLETEKRTARELRSEITKDLDWARHLSELAVLEGDEPSRQGGLSVSELAGMVERAQTIYVTATVLTGETELEKWTRIDGSGSSEEHTS